MMDFRSDPPSGHAYWWGRAPDRFKSRQRIFGGSPIRVFMIKRRGAAIYARTLMDRPRAYVVAGESSGMCLAIIRACVVSSLTPSELLGDRGCPTNHDRVIGTLEGRRRGSQPVDAPASAPARGRSASRKRRASPKLGLADVTARAGAPAPPRGGPRLIALCGPGPTAHSSFGRSGHRA
jgi:hypothetical protein